MREAVMLERRNIARREVLVEMAHHVAGQQQQEKQEQQPTPETVSFDAARFERDLTGAAALDAFREDLRHVRYHRIERFPSLAVDLRGKRRRLAVGYRSLEALRAITTL